MDRRLFEPPGRPSLVEIDPDSVRFCESPLNVILGSDAVSLSSLLTFLILILIVAARILKGMRMPFLFAVTLFISAALLFLIEPMIAKMILPRFGGTPAVWITCMVFFQAALLAGYGYAHLATKWLGLRRQAGLHVLWLLLPAVSMPIGIAVTWTPQGQENPAWLLLGVL